MKWNAYVTILTAASFVPVSMLSFMSVMDNWIPVLQFFGLAFMGLVQGALIGFGQAVALRGTVMEVPLKPWVYASTLGAGALWILGQIPGYFVSINFGNVFIAIGSLIVALAFLAFFGFVQWRVLRHRVKQAWRWIIITVYSWMAGLLIFIIGGFLIRNVSNIVIVVVAFTAFGTIAVIAVSVLSGFGMRLIAQDRIANPRYGTILPDTPRVNAAKRTVRSASDRARVRTEKLAKKAAAEASKRVKGRRSGNN